MEVRGFWKGDDLWWRIGDEQVSDRELSTWCWHNLDGVRRYTVPVVRKYHTDAYAKRPR